MSTRRFDPRWITYYAHVARFGHEDMTAAIDRLRVALLRVASS